MLKKVSLELPNSQRIELTWIGKESLWQRSSKRNRGNYLKI
jgi:hypothetical protein